MRHECCNEFIKTDNDVNTYYCYDFRIADDMLDELVEGVAGEVGQVCDGCVENLYNSEFLRPP